MDIDADISASSDEIHRTALRYAGGSTNLPISICLLCQNLQILHDINDLTNSLVVVYVNNGFV